VPVTGLVLTKLDGTAKGGIAFALTMATKLPIYFVGVGEAAEDLRPFDPEEFVNALLDRDVQN
jgi:fused signal recognition particle receptor